MRAKKATGKCAGIAFPFGSRNVGYIQRVNIIVLDEVRETQYDSVRYQQFILCVLTYVATPSSVPSYVYR